MIGQELLANHKIMAVLENSKIYNDLIIDEFPGIFVTINADGVILKGNQEMALLLQVDMEYVLREEFHKLFKKETWSIFNSHLEKLFKYALDSVEFELPINNISSQGVREYFWKIRPMGVKKLGREGALCSVVGMDISQLRIMERQLVEIYSSIPLGILTINQIGQIEDKYSAFTEYLLNFCNISGRSFKQVFFSEYLGKSGQEVLEKGLQNIQTAFTQSEFVFDELRSTFPQQVKIQDKWIGFSYQGIFIEGQLKKILVILEDRSRIMSASEENEKKKLMEDQTIARIVQLKKCEEKVLPMVVKELLKQNTDMDKFRQEVDLSSLVRAIHSIKGNSRVLGLKDLTHLSHQLESILRDCLKMKISERDWVFIDQELAKLKKEWKEVYAVYLVLFGQTTQSAVKENSVNQEEKGSDQLKDLFKRYNTRLGQTFDHEFDLMSERLMFAVQSMNYSSLQTLEDLISVRVAESSQQLGKKVKVNFAWKDVTVDEHCKNEISNCLLHLITNAIDHGIESPEERMQAGKDATGQIQIRAYMGHEGVLCEVIDDGKGIDKKKVLAKAMQLGIISLEESFHLKDEEIFPFIFRPDFTTAEQVDHTSGRGLGLDIVKRSLVAMSGHLQVKSKAGGGTQFNLQLERSKELSIDKQLSTFGLFEQGLVESLNNMNQHEGFKLRVNMAMNAVDSDGKFCYMDIHKLILGLTTTIGHFSQRLVTDLNYYIDGQKFICRIEREEKQTPSGDLEKAPMEYDLAANFCETFILKHGGEITKLSDFKWQIQVGYILGPQHIPPLNVGLVENLDLNQNKDLLKITLGHIKEILESMKIKVHFDLKNEGPCNLFVKELVVKQETAQILPGPFVYLSSNQEDVKRDLLKSLSYILSGKRI